MNLRRELRGTIDDIERVFPFDGFLSEATYHMMYSISYALRKHMPTYENKRLLDIGSGAMEKTGIFKLLGFDCYAADDLNDPWHFEDNNRSKIMKYAKDLGIHFHLQENEDYSIPFKRNSYDVVCSISVIEHLHESPRSMLKQMGSFVRPNGLLLFVTPNSVNLRKRLSVLIGRTNYPGIEMFFASDGLWRGHVREYTLREAKYICKASGFEVLVCKTFESIVYEKLPIPFRQLYLLLVSLIPRTGSYLLVVCRKPESWEPVKEY